MFNYDGMDVFGKQIMNVSQIANKRNVVSTKLSKYYAL